jgi:hypothetical protein
MGCSCSSRPLGFLAADPASAKPTIPLFSPKGMLIALVAAAILFGMATDSARGDRVR